MTTMMPFFLFFGLGTAEMVVIMVVGLIVFGRRLPEVGRSLGKTFVEFKAGLQDVQSELRDVDRIASERAQRRPEPRPVESVARGDVVDVVVDAQRDAASESNPEAAKGEDPDRS